MSGRGGGDGSLATRSYDRLPAIQPSSSREAVWAVDTRTASRIEFLEDRLVQQEKTTQSLLDRAFKIKEDIIDNLNVQHGTWQEEKQARTLLQEHIRTITDVVRKLSHDIQSVEQQIVTRESALSGTNNNVKNLELHHVAGVTDLRGRVARCDASISRLAADLGACYDSVKAISKQHADDYSRLTDKTAHVDSKVADLYARLDKHITEHNMQIQHLESELSRQIASQDARTRSLCDELKGRINAERGFSMGEREKLESRIVNTMERALQLRDNKHAEHEKKVEEVLKVQQGRIIKLEEQLIKERERNAAAIQEVDSRLGADLDSRMRKEAEEIRKLKANYREGFSDVQESMTNMKLVLEGNRKLGEERLIKDIGQIRKMVVLI